MRSNVNLKQMLNIISLNYDGYKGEGRFHWAPDQKGMRFVVPYALYTSLDKDYGSKGGKIVLGIEGHLYKGLIVQPTDVVWDSTVHYDFDDFRRDRVAECDPGTRESFIIAKAPTRQRLSDVEKVLVDNALYSGAFRNSLELHGDWDKSFSLDEDEFSQLRNAIGKDALEKLDDITEEQRLLLHLLYLPTISAQISVGTKDVHSDYIITLPEAFSEIETERTRLASSKQRMTPTFHEL